MSRTAISIELRPQTRRLVRTSPIDVSAVRTYAAPILLAAISVVASIPILGNWCNLSPDSFTYLTAARSVFESGSFPHVRLIAPPGYPLILAPLMMLGDLPIFAFRIFAVTCLMAISAQTWFLFRRELGNWGAFLAGFLVSISGPMLTQSTFILSEIAFTPLAISCLLIGLRWRGGKVPTAFEIVIAGLYAGSTAVVRSVGLVIAPVMLWAYLCSPCKSRGRRMALSLAFLLSFAIPSAIWSVRQGMYPSDYGYGTVWTTARSIEKTNLRGMGLQLQRLGTFGPQRLADLTAVVIPEHLGWRLVSGGAAPFARWIIGGGLVVIAVLRLVRSKSPVDLFFLLMMGMLAVWPWNEGVRLVTPLIPLLAGYICWLIVRLFDKFAEHPWRTRVLAAVATVFLAGQLAELPYVLGALSRQGGRTCARIEEMQRVAQWQNEKLPKEAGFVSVTPIGDNSKLVLIGASYFSRRPISGFSEFDNGHIELDSSPNTPEFWFTCGNPPETAIPEEAVVIGQCESFQVFGR